MYKSPIYRVGAKDKQLKRLLPLFPNPNTYDHFYDLFGGSGVVGMNINKPPQNKHFNEIDNNLYQMVMLLHKNSIENIMNNATNIISKYKLNAFDKEGYYKFRNDIIKWQVKAPIAKRALIYFVLYHFSFSNFLYFNAQGFLTTGTTFGKREFKPKLVEEKLQHFKAVFPRNITNLPYQQVILKPNSFIYIDPPYLGTSTDYIKQRPWDENSEKALLEWIVQQHINGHKIAFSNNVSPHLEKWAKKHNFYLHYIKHSQTLGAYHKKGTPLKTQELLITTYQVQDQTQLNLFDLLPKNAQNGPKTKKMPLNTPLKVIELFGGIGAPKKALTNLGIPHEIIDYVEFDKNATNAYNLIHNTNHQPLDIRNYTPKDQEIDLIFQGSPCQSFSNAGKGEGGAKGSGTKSSLLWEVIRIVKSFTIPPKIIIWENVKGVLNKNHKPVFDEYIEELNTLGYRSTYEVLDASHFGIPQKRQRIFVVSIHNNVDLDFTFDLKTRPMQPLNSFLETQVDKKYSIKQMSMIKAVRDKKIRIVKDTIYTNLTKQWRWNSAGVVKIPFYNFNQENYVFLPKETKTKLNTITARGANSRLKIALPIKEYSNFFIYPRAKDGELVNGAYNRVWKGNTAPTVPVANIPKIRIDYSKIEELPVFEIDNKHYHIRVLTPKEALTLMGFSTQDYEAIKDLPDSAIYKVAGNSIVVQVIEAIFEKLLDEHIT